MAVVAAAALMVAAAVVGNHEARNNEDPMTRNVGRIPDSGKEQAFRSVMRKEMLAICCSAIHLSVHPWGHFCTSAPQNLNSCALAGIPAASCSWLSPTSRV